MSALTTAEYQFAARQLSGAFVAPSSHRRLNVDLQRENAAMILRIRADLQRDSAFVQRELEKRAALLTGRPQDASTPRQRLARWRTECAEWKEAARMPRRTATPQQRASATASATASRSATRTEQAASRRRQSSLEINATLQSLLHSLQQTDFK